MGRHEYAEELYAVATARGLRPGQVHQSDYAAVCALLGFDPDDCPADFFYRNVRRVVASRMRDERTEATREDRRKALRQKVREILADHDVEVGEDGESFVVKRRR